MRDALQESNQEPNTGLSFDTKTHRDRILGMEWTY
jgi:hypothetical protein